MREYGQRKSIMDRTVLYPLFELKGIAWHEFEFSKVSYPPGPTDRRISFGETAAEIANLDLVITVDSAVAHLAGAMGKPVWLMMHTQGSWHWMRERTDSPWYPSVSIVRQETSYEWSGVIETIRTRLLERLG